MTLKAGYDVTEDDIRAWIRFALAQRDEVQRSVRMAMVLLPIITTLLGWLVEGALGAAVGLAFGLIMGLLVFPQLMKRTIDGRIETAIEQLPDGIVGPHSLEVLDDRIVWTTTAVHSTWKRSAIRRVAKTADHAFVMLGPENAIVVPLRNDAAGQVSAVVGAIEGAPPPILPRPV